MQFNVLLLQPLSTRDQTVTLSSGPISLDTEMLIPADAEPQDQECIAVISVISKTQAKVIRGARSTIARSWAAGTPITVSSDSFMYERSKEEATEPEAETIRPPRRQQLDIGLTAKQHMCPTCGRLLEPAS
jgi:hypothetical protein